MIECVVGVIVFAELWLRYSLLPQALWMQITPDRDRDLL